jgi:hypothetical protein
VLQLIDNPERCRRMGAAARAWVLCHYVNGRVLGRTVRFYKSLLDRNLPSVSRRKPASEDSVLNPI